MKTKTHYKKKAHGKRHLILLTNIYYIYCYTDVMESQNFLRKQTRNNLDLDQTLLIVGNKLIIDTSLKLLYATQTSNQDSRHCSDVIICLVNLVFMHIS